MSPAGTALTFACILTALLLSGTRAAGAKAATESAVCEGDACSQVTVVFDESKQLYHAQNNSADRWARVTASNLAATATACLGPGRDAYLALKSIDGPYRADLAEAGCGEQGPEGAPPGAE